LRDLYSRELETGLYLAKGEKMRKELEK